MKFWSKAKRRLMYLIADELGAGEVQGAYSVPEMTFLSLWRAGFIRVSLTDKGLRALAFNLDVDADGEPPDLAAASVDKPASPSKPPAED